MTTEKKKRGFANMPKQQVSEIAKKGGVEAHKKGRAHTWDSESARKAGSLGGRATHAKKRGKAAAAGAAPAPTDAKDPNRMVHAVCASPKEGGACGGTMAAKDAGPEFDEIEPQEGGEELSGKDEAAGNCSGGGSCGSA